MSADYVEVVAVREDVRAPASETTAVRLLGMLPDHWACEPEVEDGLVRLRIHLAGTGGTAAVYGTVRRVLADRALYGWYCSESRGAENR